MSLAIRVVVGTDLVFLDLYQNEPVLMNISFSEIQNITSKNSAFSQSFQLPGTKVNNQVFDYYYDISSTPINFNPNNKFPAVMTWDGLEILDGNMRLESVIIDKDEIIYNVTFYNQIGDLAANIGDKFLNQVDTTSINHPFTEAVIYESQIDPNLFRLTGATSYSYQDGRTFWGLYNVGYEYSDSLSGAGLSQFYTNMTGIAGSPGITISAGQKRFKIVYADPNKEVLNVGDYIRLTDSGTSYYVEGTVLVVDREAITFNAEYGLGTGTYINWVVERILQNNVINKANTPLISFSPPLTTGATFDNSAAKPGYFDFSGTPIQDYYFKPSIQVKTLYELIVNQAGYEIESDFFNTSYFQRYYLPLKFEETIYPNAAITPCYSYVNTDVILSATPIDLKVLNPSSGVTCSSSVFTATTTQLLYPSTYVGTLTWQVSLEYEPLLSCTSPGIKPYFYLGYDDTVNPRQLINFQTNVCLSGSQTFNFTIQVPSSGIIEFKMVGWRTKFNTITITLLDAPKYLEYGQTFNYANEFPVDQYKQIDFITSINRYFNLLVIPSPDNPQKLIIEPMIDYIGKGQVLDWTTKVDFSSPISIQPTTSIINGTLKYNFLLDSDWVNQQFNISNNKIFGTYEFQLNQEYKESKIEFNTMFASPTDYEVPNTDLPAISVPSMFAVKTNTEKSDAFLTLNPYKAIPRIVFRGITLPNFNYEIGTYWYGSSNLTIIPFDRWQTINRFNTYPFSYNDFSHYLNYDASDTYQSNESVFPYQQDLYDIYYGDYISDLTSNENKIVSGKIYLTPWEISQLRFDEKILIQNNYFRINKISNYNLSEPSICDIELVKLTREYDPHPIMYYTFTSCNPLFESLFTNSDLMFNLYGYIGRYVRVYSESGTDYGCFQVNEDVYDPNRTYYHYWLGTGYTSEGVGIYDDCTCTGDTSMIIVQESPTPSPTPTNTPTPSITPTNTPTVTPTPSFTPTPSVTPPTVCFCYWILNETGGSLDYEYTPCGTGTPVTLSLGAGGSVRRCSSTAPFGAGLTITACSSTTFCSTDDDCAFCT